MNNDDFTKLVRQKVKTTKEIAREAVEDEFRRQKKRHGRNKKNSRGSNNDGYSTNSGDDSRNNNSKRYHDQKKSHDATRIENSNKRKRIDIAGELEQDSHLNYRDRAKERRTGKQEQPSSATNDDHNNKINHNDNDSLLFDDLVDAIETNDRIKLHELQHNNNINDISISEQLRQQSKDVRMDHDTTLLSRYQYAMSMTKEQLMEYILQYDDRTLPNHLSDSMDDITKLKNDVMTYWKYQLYHNHQQQRQIKDDDASYNTNELSMLWKSIDTENIHQYMMQKLRKIHPLPHKDNTRNTLTFTIDANPYDTFRSWEIPFESQQLQKIELTESSDNSIPKLTVCKSSSYLHQLQLALHRIEKRKQQQQQQTEEKKQHNGTNQEQQRQLESTKKISSASFSDKNHNATATNDDNDGKPTPHDMIRSSDTKNDDSDDDDDIFANVGEYNSSEVILQIPQQQKKPQAHERDDDNDKTNDNTASSNEPKHIETYGNNTKIHDDNNVKKLSIFSTTHRGDDDDDHDDHDNTKNDISFDSSLFTLKRINNKSLYHKDESNVSRFSLIGNDNDYDGIDMDFNARDHYEEEEDDNHHKMKNKDKKRNKHQQ